jgi:hypothetical protein
VLIDRGDAFVFGFSKLDVMFGRLSGPGLKPVSDFARSEVENLRLPGEAR